MAWSSNRFCDFGGRLNRYAQGLQNTTRNGCTVTKSNSSTASSGGLAVSKLQSLRAGTTAIIIGVVIAKESPKSIFSRKMTVSNAQVQTNPSDGTEEKFRVSTPLPFHLTLSENHSTVTLYDGLDLGSYASLQYIPTKPSSDFYTLEDVLANGQNLEGEHINLLAAIRKLGPAKDITTKTGKHTRRCELKLFDETCSSFPLVLWGEEIVDYALSWIPLETVLFAADVRMSFDHYRQCMIATSDSKTVFTPNPDTVEGQCLYQYAQTQSFPSEDDVIGPRELNDPPLDQIQEVVTIEEVFNRKQGGNSDYAIIYGILTSFDLDAENTDRFFRRRCPKCKQIVKSEAGYQCVNTECTQGALSMFNATGEISVGEPEKEFSLRTSISDHTGTVSQCRLNGAVIEHMLGWNPNDLVQMDAERRTGLKWQYLLERCKFYVKVIHNVQDPMKVSLKILSCSRAEPEELLRYYKTGQQL